MRAQGWLALVITLAWAVPARADDSAACPESTADPEADRAAAKALFEQALMMEPSNPERALEALHCAEKLAPRAAIALRIGTIAERLGHTAEAADAFERYLELAGEHAPDAEPMRERITKLRTQLESKKQEEERPPQAPQSGQDASSAFGTQSVVGVVAGGTGLAFAIVGASLLGAAKADSDSVHDIEPGTTAWSSDEASGTLDRAELEQSLGIVGIVLGASLLTLGAVLIGTDDGASDSSVAVAVAPQAHGVSGAFRVQF